MEQKTGNTTPHLKYQGAPLKKFYQDCGDGQNRSQPNFEVTKSGSRFERNGFEVHGHNRTVLETRGTSRNTGNFEPLSWGCERFQRLTNRGSRFTTSINAEPLTEIQNTLRVLWRTESVYVSKVLQRGWKQPLRVYRGQLEGLSLRAQSTTNPIFYLEVIRGVFSKRVGLFPNFPSFKTEVRKMIVELRLLNPKIEYEAMRWENESEYISEIQFNTLKKIQDRLQSLMNGNEREPISGLCNSIEDLIEI